MQLLEKGLKTILLFFTNPGRLRFLLGLNFYGYFLDVNFFESQEKKVPVGKNGEKLPWLTYSLISFLDERLKKTLSVFEYGSGYSTHYFAKRCKNVTSVEHHTEWYNIVKNELPENCTLIHETLSKNGDYSNAPSKLNEAYDVILVDGRDRNNCIKNCMAYLSESGVIIVDDSHRERYLDGQEHLLSKGFKKIDFWGPAPSTFNNKSSTVFYRDNNCFDI